MSNQTRFVYILAGLVFLTGVGFLFWFGYQYLQGYTWGTAKVEVRNENQLAKEKKCDYYRLVDGVCVDSFEKVNPKLVAVMVENHFEAWPQAGLAEASVVYEAPTEANIPRFLAIYSADTTVAKVGPVRSARPYYLDWLSEYGSPLYMHVGGSPEALDLIDQYKINDLNQFYKGDYYWRANNHQAPHNVYTSSELWGKAVNKQLTMNNGQDNWTGWKFNTTTFDHLTTSSPTVRQINVSFAPPTYEVNWQYSSSTNRFTRYQAGEIHLMENSQPIIVDTVIVEEMKMQVIDEQGRKKVTTVGRGRLLVFVNGQIVSGNWDKSLIVSRTKFYNTDGQEILLNPGHIWIEVVPDMSIVNYQLTTNN